jgi:SAM-dependent methyltransferase
MSEISPRIQPVDAGEFWNSVYSISEYGRAPDAKVLNLALGHFGSVERKSMLEIGGGPGAASLYFGRLGADVTDLDTSQKAVEDLNALVRAQGIENVRGVCATALDLSSFPQVDFVYGSMILHHLEPFDVVVTELRRVLKPGGRAFFYENSAASKLLMWFRTNLVGKLWIPKCGDQDEFPLTAEEIQMLKAEFRVEVRYPEMMFFGMADRYLFKKKLTTFCRAIDSCLYRTRWLAQYSYHQCILIYG